MDFDELSNRAIGCAIEVHRHLGPGLLESTYEQCLARELSAAEIAFTIQHPLPVHYKDFHIECGCRVDVLVENSQFIAIKSVETIAGIHEAQLRTCIKLSGTAPGLLINFNVPRQKMGLNGLFSILFVFFVVNTPSLQTTGSRI